MIIKERKTNETDIKISLELYGVGNSKIETGVPFLDHMLDQIARHGLMDLTIDCKGDNEIDDHHTVEDIGITLGQAFEKAIGDKLGIRRYGHAFVPLDEALSRVVLDISGRPGFPKRIYQQIPHYTFQRLKRADQEFQRGYVVSLIHI